MHLSYFKTSVPLKPQRRMQQIEKLSSTKKRQILQVIDTFIENEQLKQQAS